MKRAAKNRKLPIRKVAVLQYNVNNLDDYQRIADAPKTKAWVYGNLVDAVKLAISHKSTTIDLFKLMDSDICLTLPKEGWKTSLNKAMEFFAEKEMFEICNECKILIEKI